MFYYLVVGPRTFKDYEMFKNAMDKLINEPDSCLVIGDAPGTDKLAAKYAEEKGYQTKVFSTDPNLKGRLAGNERAERMNQYISQFEHRMCLIFDDNKSKMSSESSYYAYKYNNPCKWYSINSNSWLL